MRKDIKGFPGYQVCENGTVERVMPDGTRRILKVATRGVHSGQVSLRDENGKIKQRSISRIVYEAFVGRLSNQYIVRHKNGNGHDYRPENLYKEKRYIGGGNPTGKPKAVEKVNRDGEVIATYRSGVAAADAEFYAPDYISKLCRRPVKKQLKTREFAFRYKQ